MRRKIESLRKKLIKNDKQERIEKKQGDGEERWDMGEGGEKIGRVERGEGRRGEEVYRIVLVGFHVIHLHTIAVLRSCKYDAIRHDGAYHRRADVNPFLAWPSYNVLS